VHPPEDETFSESHAVATPLARPEPHLVLVLECDRPLSGSSRHCLRGVAEVTIGRGSERAASREGQRLALTLPSRWTSTTHARIRCDGDRWVLEDLGSRNGTRVNGKPVVHLALADGDLIEAGHTLLLFREALHAPPTAPLDFEMPGEGASRQPGLETLVPALAIEIEALVRIAASSLPVLLRGETGTGKEVVARAVHALSKRAGAFVAVNCGALPHALVESHLFGHVKGAFSGAIRDEPGFVRAASGGMLFLDEIGDLPAASQAALLRVLQESEVVPVGTTRPVRVDLRVVAATHQPLEALVARGTFRTDLLARLDGFTFALPPLRERREDLGLLVADLLRPPRGGAEGPKLSPEAGRALLQYSWPLNIRELRHCLQRASALAEGEEEIDVCHLPPPVQRAGELDPDGAIASAEASDATSDVRLRTQLETLLAEHDGNVARVARAVGKARMQVHRWLKRFEIDPRRYRP
jgi:transcriptional regulator of acetoin/glycerol metabolism